MLHAAALIEGAFSRNLLDQEAFHARGCHGRGLSCPNLMSIDIIGPSAFGWRQMHLPPTKRPYCSLWLMDGECSLNTRKLLGALSSPLRIRKARRHPAVATTLRRRANIALFVSTSP
jgi:hypothetical protein